MNHTVHMLCCQTDCLYTTCVVFTVREAGHPLDGHKVHIQVNRWDDAQCAWVKSDFAEGDYKARTGTYSIDSARIIWNKLRDEGYVLPPSWLSSASIPVSAKP
jgi:hypothetical protein